MHDQLGIDLADELKHDTDHDDQAGTAHNKVGGSERGELCEEHWDNGDNGDKEAAEQIQMV